MRVDIYFNASTPVDDSHEQVGICECSKEWHGTTCNLKTCENPDVTCDNGTKCFPTDQEPG